jgi:hypothetical protein
MMNERFKMNDFLIPAGSYLLCDVDSIREFCGVELIAFTVPSGVYYSSDDTCTEVYVGDYDDETAVGRVGLIPGSVAVDVGYDADDLITFGAGAVACADETGFSFGSLVFEV